jgi:plastocyanin
MGYVWPIALAAFMVISASGLSGQLQYSSGQEVAPDFSGWEANEDGSFNFVFGYMNRNYDEHLYIPIGANNKFEPGEIDRGQPTYFYPRRGRYVFRVKVPADFGSKELVWTLTSNGKTRRAYATLKPDYALDNPAIYLNNSGYSMVGKAVRNKAPVVGVEGAMQRAAKVGEALTLTAHVTDDGIPQTRPAPLGQGAGFKSAMGLRVAWIVYRGPGDKVTFTPEQFKVYGDFAHEGANSPYTPGWVAPPLPPDGKHTVKATFTAPGTYVVRVTAHDGGFETAKDVTVKVE